MSNSETIGDYTLAEDNTRCNLTLVLSPAGLLMGMKTRGFGTGKLVLPGGKEKFFGPGFQGKRKKIVDVQEELYEETGLSLPYTAFAGVGYLYVEPDYGETTDILLVKTELPQTPGLSGNGELEHLGWYPTQSLPYNQMPTDYRLWLPGALDNYIITAFLRNINTDFSNSVVFGQRYLPKLGRLEELASGPITTQV